MWADVPSPGGPQITVTEAGLVSQCWQQEPGCSAHMCLSPRTALACRQEIVFPDSRRRTFGEGEPTYRQQ